MAFIKTSIGANEANNCAVVAIATAMDIDYQEVHEVFASYGRKEGQPTFVSTIVSVLLNEFQENHGGLLWNLYGDSHHASAWVKNHGFSYAKHKGATLGSLLKEKLSKGRFVCSTKDHMFAVIDGDVIDASPVPMTARIYTVTEIRE